MAVITSRKPVHNSADLSLKEDAEILNLLQEREAHGIHVVPPDETLQSNRTVAQSSYPIKRSPETVIKSQQKRVTLI